MTWETLTNREIIEYHPSFRFGPKLQLFLKKLRDKISKQRKEYKDKRSGKSDKKGNLNKRAIKNLRKELAVLEELVSVSQVSDNESYNNVKIF